VECLRCLAEKSEENRPRGGQTQREIGWGSADWFHLVQDRDQ
jgi:hypothetical protein